MNSLVVLLTVLAVANGDFSLLNEEGEARVCPESFYYVGDDADAMALQQGKSYVLVPINKSDPYSCYTLGHFGYGGLNEAISECEGQKAKLVALEDPTEVRRVFKLMFAASLDEAVTFELLTAGMYFADVDKWMWLGTNISVPYDVTATGADPSVEQCLSARSTRMGADDGPGGGGRGFEYTFKSVACNDDAVFVCEVRVVTVTYVAWFYSNWLTVMMTGLLVLLLVSLCATAVAGCRARNAPAYRRGTRGTRGANNCTYAADRSVPIAHFPFDDQPPAYPDVAGSFRKSPPDGWMNRYRTKGKDALARVYLYKEHDERGHK